MGAAPQKGSPSLKPVGAYVSIGANEKPHELSRGKNKGPFQQLGPEPLTPGGGLLVPYCTIGSCGDSTHNRLPGRSLIAQTHAR